MIDANKRAQIGYLEELYQKEKDRADKAEALLAHAQQTRMVPQEVLDAQIKRLRENDFAGMEVMRSFALGIIDDLIDAPQPSGEPVETLSADDAWRDLVEKDDRNSPEDYPEMCLITFEELRDFMQRASLRKDG
jgi:hypothetical protein